jgi:hypothetical protein
LTLTCASPFAVDLISIELWLVPSVFGVTILAP